MIRMIAQSENGNWETNFGNTNLIIGRSKGRYKVMIYTLTNNGGFGFSTRRNYLSDAIEQANNYLKKLDGSRIILIVSKDQQSLCLSTAD